MEIEFTREQKKVIELHQENILVSAAAGSGKTAVLVERIIQMVSDASHPVDIDRLLIVTFTNAAAGEMRDRISSAIADKLSEHPENEHLQRQSALIHHAQITTIDSFCLFLIRNHFQDIGIDPAFRVADEGEMELLKQDVLAELLEEQFTLKRPAFLHCVECYSTGKKETILEQSIFSLFRFAMSYPWPIDWLEEHKKDYEISDIEQLIASDFVQYGRKYLHHILPELMGQIKKCNALCEQADGPYMYGENIEHTMEQLEKCVESNTWETDRNTLESVLFERLSSKKDDSVNSEKRELVKNIRNMVKKQIESLKAQFFAESDEAILRQCYETGPAVRELLELTILFVKKFEQAKREKNLVDFSDMEHMALQILCKKEEEIVPTETAKEYQSYFEEIMVDEYQDSNLVQECILQSISRKNNRFMVGDVKQSIYRFRLARPELFMEKYHSYSTEHGPDRRIDLHQNFRSRSEVIESVNILFEQLMDESLGGITYDASAALRQGASYPENNKPYENQTELILREKDKESGTSSISQEAVMVAEKVQEICSGMYHITDKKTGELREACYGDIVILLRSSAGVDEVFKQAMEERDIPCFINSKTGYFLTTEISLLMQLLRILDNPIQDIPLFGVLHSVFGEFTNEDLALVKVGRPVKESLYRSLERYAGILRQDETYEQEEIDFILQEKCQKFLKWLEDLRLKTAYMSISELLEEILMVSHYAEYVSALPAGEQRYANVLMLLEKARQFEHTSFKGLYHFIRYIDQLEKYNVDYGEAVTLDENANVVRIMTIHKSKGLEFPICFVSGLGKKINRRDLTSPVITDIDMGVGADLINPDLRIRRKTLRKNILSRKLLLDNQAEEMRVLYVACTRAKEKLILTGIIETEEKIRQEIAPFVESGISLLPFSFRSGATSYLMWVIASFLDKKISVTFQRPETREQNVDKQKKYIINGVQTFINQINAGVMNQKMVDNLQKKFSYQYTHQSLKDLYAKTTVSEMKQAQRQEQHFDNENQGKLLFETETLIPYIPSFIKEKETISGIVRGNAMHRLMEVLDFSSISSQGQMEEQIQELVQKHSLSQEYGEAVEQEKVKHFLESGLAKRMVKAQKRGQLHREQPFVLGISADRLNKDFPSDEMILVQGIIDVYMEEDGEIILVDYKTDVVKSKMDLVQRYEIQLQYYAEALERITGKKVREKIIYSFFLECEIQL